MVITAVSVMTMGFASCGSKKKTTGNTASGGELKDVAKVEKESTEETKIYLENTSDETIILKDEKGNEITITEGETLPIVEKTTDKSGEELYVLSNGSTIKASGLSSSAKEVITSTSSGENTANGSSSSKETTKNVVKNENPTEAPTKKLSETPTAVPAQPQTPAPTQKPTEASTAAPVQPQTPTPTQKPTEASTVAPVQPQTPAPTQKPTEAPTQAPQPAYEGYRTDLDMQAKQLILQERANSNISGTDPNPTWNEHLYRVAQARAKEIATDFSHNSIGNCKSGYNVAEAIAYFLFNDINSTPATAIQVWKNSPAHYSIMVIGDQFAVASYQKGDTMYWVCITGNDSDYIAENCASMQAADWGSRYEEKYQKYYNSFVEEFGNRNIW